MRQRRSTAPAGSWVEPFTRWQECERNWEIEAKNVASFQRARAAFDARDPEGSVGDFGPESIWYSDVYPEPIVGKKEAAEKVALIFKTFPDATFDLLNVLPKGYFLLAFFLVRGIKTVNFMGLPPRSAPFQYFRMILSQYDPNVVRVTAWDAWDAAAVLRQQGFIPESFKRKKTVITGAGYRSDETLLAKGRARNIAPTPLKTKDKAVRGSPYGMFRLEQKSTAGDLRIIEGQLGRIANFIVTTLSDNNSHISDVVADGVKVGECIRAPLYRSSVERGYRFVIGQSVGRVEMDWRVVPDDFNATDARSSPPIALQTDLSQRFAMRLKLEFDDPQGSSLSALGTGRTWPADRSGIILWSGVVLQITESAGKLLNQEGLIVTQGDLTTTSSHVEIAVRVLNRNGDLRTKSKIPVHNALPAPTPEITTVAFAGGVDPDHPVLCNISQAGKFLSADAHEQLRLVGAQMTTSRPEGLRSRTRKFLPLGAIRFKVKFPAFKHETTLPFRAQDAVFELKDTEGRLLGSIHADIEEGVAIPTKLPGLSIPTFRMGGLAPIRSGEGLFEGVSGLITVNSWFSLVPEYISSLFLVRIWDPSQRIRSTLSRAWQFQ